MSATAVRVRPDTYVDSVVLMSGARAMRDLDGVAWATAVMGTDANLDELRSRGFKGDDLGSARANDLVLAVEAGSEEEAREALDAGMRALSESGGGAAEGPKERGPRSLQQAVADAPDVNVALISVPGEHAPLEAHKALSAGLHVLLFSDNVPLDDEVELKVRGRELRRFVMGPGAGTAILGGVGLGFANVVQRGPVGVVAAAGTGAQEVSSLLDRWGVGVRDLIGVGGRDLSERVEGGMTRMALEAFEADDEVEVVLLVSKPPAPDVAADLVRRLGEGKPAVAVLLGLADDLDPPEGVLLARTLEDGVLRTLEVLGRDGPELSRGLEERVGEAIEGLDRDRTAVRGLFSGGTLCYEAMIVLSERLEAEVRSNTPLKEGWGLPAPDG
ncbi:MAG TPA: protein FdrA, partial [Actinomycetota bacterium]